MSIRFHGEAWGYDLGPGVKQVARRVVRGCCFLLRYAARKLADDNIKVEYPRNCREQVQAKIIVTFNRSRLARETQEETGASIV